MTRVFRILNLNSIQQCLTLKFIIQQVGSSPCIKNGFEKPLEDPLSFDGLEDRDEASGAEDDMIDDDENLVRIPKRLQRKMMGSSSDEDEEKIGNEISNRDRSAQSEVKSQLKKKKTQNKDDDKTSAKIKQ